LKLIVCISLALAVSPLAASQEKKNVSQSYFTDVVLLDQDGKPNRFYSDLLKGKVVVIDSFFASCKDSCPLLAGNMSKVQEALGDRLGSKVLLLSITVDPENDTPEKLKAYASRFKARPGWFFLTGKKEDVAFILNKLGQAVAKRDDHLTTFVIGREPTSQWAKASGLEDPAKVLALVEKLLNEPDGN